MSLPALRHRKLTTATAASNAINDMLDAIWTAIKPTVTTYSDGSTRDFTSTGTGWTWTRYQNAGVTEALYGVPPTGSLNQRIIIAGRSTTPTPSPTMLVDTFVANRLMIAHAKNAGAFASWNAAAPFTSGQFTGYVALGANSPTAPVTITIIESEETMHIGVGTGASGGTYGAGAGALIDPDTGDSVDGESDGRVYGLWTGGTSTFATMLTNAVVATFMQHGASSTNAHFVTWNPGTSTVLVTARTNFYFNMSSLPYTTRLGKLPGIPQYAITTNNWCGRIREMRVIRPAIFGQRIDASGVNKGYVFGTSTTTSADAVLFSY